jgi:2-iminoacetate synthase
MNIINPEIITTILANNQHEDPIKIKEILAKAQNAKGLTFAEVAALLPIKSPDLLTELFATSKKVKEEIYGNRLVIFAPLYVSNLCKNECLYCAFRATNKELKRRSLTQEEILQETQNLINQGQKRILLVAGESYPQKGFQYILDAIATIYSLKNEHGEIRRINVNIAPLTLEDFQLLKQAEIGTYQLFQETYHPEIYQQVHIGGKKADYLWRLTAIDRAMQAKIDDVGIGVLFGLADWRFEILALMQHIQHLNNTFGIGPHTISVPRLEPALGAPIASNPPHAVSDKDFCKIIAILRLAVPYTGIILSTRETAKLRSETLALGISQISAGSRTNPGGYTDEAASDNETAAGQFSLGDHRPLDEVVKDIATAGYLPSFCTACYKVGRTGERFMDLAKSGKIKNMCSINACITFQEYLTNYATPETRLIGEKLISKMLENMPQQQRQTAQNIIDQIKNGVKTGISTI